MNPSIPELIASREENHPLRGLFYHDPEIYAADLARIWRVGWLFAVHSCELREPGDYVTVDIDADSLIVLRADDGKAHAFYNVCRHRGTRLRRSVRQDRLSVPPVGVRPGRSARELPWHAEGG